LFLALGSFIRIFWVYEYGQRPSPVRPVVVLWIVKKNALKDVELDILIHAVLTPNLFIGINALGKKPVWNQSHRPIKAEGASVSF
jgi:hypothetical protein